MIQLQINNIPNQSFTSTLDNRVYEIAINSLQSVMVATISRDGVVLISGNRMIAGVLLPYLYQESGNFVLLTNNGDLPDYTQFGISQFLIYASQDEIEALRAGN